MKIRILYTPYERYEDVPPIIGHVIAPTLEEALFKALENKVNIYTGHGFKDDMEEELGRPATAEDILNHIKSMNGDGCDYIHSILNEETGEELMEGDAYVAQEWTLE